MQNGIPLLKVLLVDDEPFIRKGLATLIDWETEGYYIAGEASNGLSAIELLKHNDYDLIISDIKMPEIDGIELITYVRDNKISSAKFIILSGFYDFQYAKTAIQYNCCDYILKPIVKEELLVAVRKIMEEYQKEVGNQKKLRDYEKAYLDRHLMEIIWGKCDSTNLKYATEKLTLSHEMFYILCEISLHDENFLALSENSRKEQQRRLYNYTNLLLKKYSNHILYDFVKNTQCYDIGIIYCSTMAKEKELSQEEWIVWLLKELTERVGYKIVAFTGNIVNSLSSISNSYREAILIRSFRFYPKYDNRNTRFNIKGVETQNSKVKYNRNQLDELIHFIEINDKQKIKETASVIYNSMMDKDIAPDEVSLSIQYFIYRLLGLGYNQDTDINQEEILYYINKKVFDSKTNKENSLNFQKFALDYSEFLGQLRQNTAKGMIGQIEAEIEKKYSENISLKLFGEKYFVNSAYLGQVFKKQYGCSFKEYLNSVRMRKAAEMIVNTDNLVCEIALAVGYKNQEYFINKFVEIYGVTPTRFRKQNRSKSI